MTDLSNGLESIMTATIMSSSLAGNLLARSEVIIPLSSVAETNNTSRRLCRRHHSLSCRAQNGWACCNQIVLTRRSRRSQTCQCRACQCQACQCHSQSGVAQLNRLSKLSRVVERFGIVRSKRFAVISFAALLQQLNRFRCCQVWGLLNPKFSEMTCVFIGRCQTFFSA